jgi:glycosyltransferase involved in cell wall biosynthesis
MRISIAMCTYNGARYLQRQLDSFAEQTCAPCEVIVCDDGSTDGTLTLVEGFAAKAGFPVRIVRNERNLGSSRNFEHAIGMCTGDLIALADQDDEWYPDKLAKMHELFVRFPEALAAFSDADIIDDDSMMVGRQLWKSLNYAPQKRVAYVDRDIVGTMLKLDYIATGATMVFRAELRRWCMPIPETWVHDAWISWIAALSGGLAPLPEETIKYRVHPAQQIGVAPASLAGQVAVAKKNAARFRLIAQRLKDLRIYLQGRAEDERLARYIPDLDAKIRLFEGRASLAGPVIQRVSWILRSWREYQRYARGPLAMVSDAVVMKEEKAT